MSATKLVQQIAAQYGISDLSDKKANDILFAYTGYPEFFNGPPLETLKKQLYDFFKSPVHQAQLKWKDK